MVTKAKKVPKKKPAAMPATSTADAGKFGERLEALEKEVHRLTETPPRLTQLDGRLAELTGRTEEVLGRLGELEAGNLAELPEGNDVTGLASRVQVLEQLVTPEGGVPLEQLVNELVDAKLEHIRATNPLARL